MNIEYKENILTADKFNLFESKMGYPMTPNKQLERALAHSLLSIAATKDNEIIGTALLNGDTASNFYIEAVYVLPDYQGKGIGSSMMKKLIQYVKETSIPETTVYVTLMCEKGKEGFYEKLGFLQRPNTINGAGMELTIDIE